MLFFLINDFVGDVFLVNTVQKDLLKIKCNVKKNVSRNFGRTITRLSPIVFCSTGKVSQVLGLMIINKINKQDFVFVGGNNKNGSKSKTRPSI